MQDKLSFENHTSPFWTYLTVGSFFLTFIFCFAWWYVTDPFTISVIRFIAFVGLAGCIFGVLHVREKNKDIVIELTKDKLCVNYFVNSRKEQEELFERKTIDQIIQTQAPAIWGVIPRKGSYAFTISFNDTDNELSLFRFGGQDLFVSNKYAQQINQFLETYLEGNG